MDRILRMLAQNEKFCAAFFADVIFVFFLSAFFWQRSELKIRRNMGGCVWQSGNITNVQFFSRSENVHFFLPSLFLDCGKIDVYRTNEKWKKAQSWEREKRKKRVTRRSNAGCMKCNGASIERSRKKTMNCTQYR